MKSPSHVPDMKDEEMYNQLLQHTGKIYAPSQEHDDKNQENNYQLIGRFFAAKLKTSLRLGDFM